MKKYADYRGEQIRRFWNYRREHFLHTPELFDSDLASDSRPPVFRPNQAWRNVLVDPATPATKREELLALVQESARHTWYGSMASSQALAQSVFGNLKSAGVLDSLADLQADDGEPLFADAQLSSANFVMEHRVSHLGEPRPTSLDGYIFGAHRVAVECKFMETGIGACSRPTLTEQDANYMRDGCSGAYARQNARTERCPLTAAGVLYWRFVPRLFHWQNDTDLAPCPLNQNYQLMRNIMAACIDAKGEVTSSGHAVLIYDARNPAFQNEGAGLTSYHETRAALFEPAMLRKCNWQRITMHLRQKGMLPWLTDHLEMKYGL